MKVATSPFDIVREPVNDSPAEGATFNVTYTVSGFPEAAPLADTTKAPAEAVPLSVAPPRFTEKLATLALLVPVFERDRVMLESVAAVGADPIAAVLAATPGVADNTDAEMLADVVDEPKMPNMYPSTAAKAMSVAAMMRTVATIGEIPFRWYADIFIVIALVPIILTLQERNY